MSDCSCGARGIDLDGHECVAWLKLRLIERSEQLAALGPWTVQTLRQYVADTSDGFECEPGCDSYGHTELCPVTNTVAAFRLLRERLAERDHVIEVARAWRRCETHGDIDGARQWGCPDCLAQQRKELREQDERIRELEQEISKSRENACRQRWDNHGAFIKIGDCQRGQLEQQLKAAPERLIHYTDALHKIRTAGSLIDAWRIAREAEEYFAKHSPEKERG